MFHDIKYSKHAKIDLTKHTLTLTELKKRLKEKYMQIRKEKGWGEDEMALSARNNSASQRNKQLQDRPHYSREDVTTVVGGMRKSTAGNG